VKISLKENDRMTNQPYETLFHGAVSAWLAWSASKPWENLPSWLAIAIRAGEMTTVWNGSLGGDGFVFPPELWGEDRIFAGRLVFRRYYYTNTARQPRLIVTVAPVNMTEAEYIVGEWWKRLFSTTVTRAPLVVNESRVVEKLLALRHVYLGGNLEEKISGTEAAALVREVVRGIVQADGGVESNPDTSTTQVDVTDLVRGML
jgi:hypothetical protein